jgi:hypothetical protein
MLRVTLVDAERRSRLPETVVEGRTPRVTLTDVEGASRLLETVVEGRTPRVTLTDVEGMTLLLDTDIDDGTLGRILTKAEDPELGKTLRKGDTFGEALTCNRLSKEQSGDFTNSPFKTLYSKEDSFPF